MEQPTADWGQVTCNLDLEMDWPEDITTYIDYRSAVRFARKPPSWNDPYSFMANSVKIPYSDHNMTNGWVFFCNVDELVYDGESEFFHTPEIIPIPQKDMIYIQLAPKSDIAQYESHIVYGYGSWIGTCGGIWTFAFAVFVWGSYFLAIFLGDRAHLGILPQLSLSYTNYELLSHLPPELFVHKGDACKTSETCVLN